MGRSSINFTGVSGQETHRMRTVDRVQAAVICMRVSYEAWGITWDPLVILGVLVIDGCSLERQLHRPQHPWHCCHQQSEVTWSSRAGHALYGATGASRHSGVGMRSCGIREDSIITGDFNLLTCAYFSNDLQRSRQVKDVPAYHLQKQWKNILELEMQEGIVFCH